MNFGLWRALRTILDDTTLAYDLSSCDTPLQEKFRVAGPGSCARIKESANKTSFWEQWVVRETDRGYELAFGHHRLQAAIELFGLKHEVSVQVEDYDEDQMLIALADENAGEGQSPEAQRDTVVTARDRLRERPESCKWEAPSAADGASRKSREAARREAEAKHLHGSVVCVCHFLGTDNWKFRRVAELLELAEKLDASLIDYVAPDGETHPNRPGQTNDGERKQRKISRTSAVALTPLSKEAQRAAVAVVREAEIEITTPEMKAVAAEVKILPAKQQAAAIATALRSKVKEKIEAREAAKLPEGNDEAFRIARELYDFPDEQDMETIIANRDLLQPRIRKELIVALNKNIERLEGYRDALLKPMPRLLGKGE